MTDATASVSASLPVALIVQLDRGASQAGITRSAFIARLLSQALAQESK